MLPWLMPDSLGAKSKSCYTSTLPWRELLYHTGSSRERRRQREDEYGFIFRTLLSANTDGVLPIGRCREWVGIEIHLHIWSGSLRFSFPYFSYLCVIPCLSVMLADFSFSLFNIFIVSLSQFPSHPFESLLWLFLSSTMNVCFLWNM